MEKLQRKPSVESVHFLWCFILKFGKNEQRWFWNYISPDLFQFLTFLKVRIPSNKYYYSCALSFVLLQVQKCFVLVQIFCASPKIWLHLVPLQKLLCWHKNQFYWMQIIFLSGTKCLWLPQYINICLVWHKRFGPAQNILGPVKGQSMNFGFNLDEAWKVREISHFLNHDFILYSS